MLIWLATYRPAFRPRAASILGGVAPLSAAFLYVTIDFVLNERSGEDAFGFYAMWIMGSSAYVASLIAGIGLSFLIRPRVLIARFATAAGVVVVLYYAFVLVME